ncbi:MAG: N-acetyltransferase family protein [Haloferacaceae archaeon]
MNAVDEPSFETDDHARVFRYVERHGAVAPDDIDAGVRLDATGVDEAVTDLKRDEYLSEFDGTLQLVLGADSAVTHERGGDSITIRPGRQDHLSTIVDAVRDVVADVRYPRAETFVGHLEQEGLLQRYNAQRTRMVFTATVAAGPVGWVHLGASALQRSRRTVEGTLGVRDEFRCRGIGTLLLQRGCAWAAAAGFGKVCQRLPATNDRAVTFLTTAGWETETIRRNHYDCGGDPVDEVKMAIDL